MGKAKGDHSMSDEYTPAMVRARALAALAAEDSGATDGERSNAIEALKRNLDRHALKMAHTAFIHRFDLFAPSKSEGKELTPEKLAALIAAMKAVEGDAWKRPAGYIGGLLLS